MVVSYLEWTTPFPIFCGCPISYGQYHSPYFVAVSYLVWTTPFPMFCGCLLSRMDNTIPHTLWLSPISYGQHHSPCFVAVSYLVWKTPFPILCGCLLSRMQWRSEGVGQLPPRAARGGGLPKSCQRIFFKFI